MLSSAGKVNDQCCPVQEKSGPVQDQCSPFSAPECRNTTEEFEGVVHADPVLIEEAKLGDVFSFFVLIFFLVVSQRSIPSPFPCR